MGLAEQRALGGIRADRGRRGLVDLDQRAAGGGQRPEDGVACSGVGEGRRRALGRAGIRGPGQAVRPAERLLDRPLGQARRRLPGRDGVRRAGQAAVGQGLDAGGLLGANDGLHERPARRIRGQRRTRQRAQERGEHRSSPAIRRIGPSLRRARLHPAGPGNGRRALVVGRVATMARAQDHRPGVPIEGSGHPDDPARTGSRVFARAGRRRAGRSAAARSHRPAPRGRPVRADRRPGCPPTTGPTSDSMRSPGS